MSVYELKTFGGLRLLDDGGIVELPRRRLAVLALLARADADGLPRERIVGCLWPDSAPTDGRHSLEQVLSALRGRLGRDLFLGTDPIRLNPERIDSDVGRFLRAHAGGDREVAAEACDGVFLDGFRLPDAWEFEEWADRERTSLRERHLSCLENLAVGVEDAGDAVGAIDWWRRAVEADPFRTSSSLGFMRALAARGDRVAAIQHARFHEKLVRSQLEVEPDGAVVALRLALETSPAERATAITPPPTEAISIGAPAALPGTAGTGPAALPAAKRHWSVPTAAAGLQLGLATAALVGLVVTSLTVFIRSGNVDANVEAAPPRAVASIDPVTYDLYLKGRTYLRNRDTKAAIASLRSVVNRSPNWAPGWASLAEAFSLDPYYTPIPDSAEWAASFDSAIGAAERALALDSTDTSAYIALGSVLRDRWDWDRAEDAYVRALALEPDDAEALQQYAEMLYYMGRIGESYQFARRFLAIDPTPLRYNIAGIIAGLDGRYDEALDLFEKGIALDPEGRIFALRTNQYMYAAYAGRWKEARELLMARVAAGRRSHLLATYEGTWRDPEGPPHIRLTEIPGIDCTYAAILSTMLGHPDRAAPLLLDCLDRPDVVPYGATYVLWHESLDPIRDDPVLQEFARRRGLAGLRPIRTKDSSR